MHCPQCGQQQISGEVRFCSRCGFPLGGVIELLANGGSLPFVEAQTGKSKRTPRYEGIRQGVIMFLLGALIVPLLGILYGNQVNGSAFLGVLLPISAVLFFVGGFVRILYALIFEEGQRAAHAQPASLPFIAPTASSQLAAGARAVALPPAQSIPVPNWRQRPNTAEIVQQPRSVTENTTRLLDEPSDKNQR